MKHWLTVVTSLGVVAFAAYLFSTRGLEAQTAPPSGPVGRYQIVINPQMRADTFLLDTATGRIWAPGRYTDYVDDPRVWELESKVDNNQQLEAFLATKTRKKPN
jgi:hypothetical protein